MATPAHSMSQLFDQLGLPSGNQEIDKFIEQQKQVADSKRIYETDFFSDSQRTFLKEVKEHGGDWAELTDTLDFLLRQPAVVRPS